MARDTFERPLEDLVWCHICQVGKWLVCSGMLPEYATSALCKFYCNGCFPLAPVVLLLQDFSLVYCAGLIEKCYHCVRALFGFGRLLFLACKAGCEPNVLNGGSMPFCIGLGGSLVDVAMQAGSDAFVIVSSIHVPRQHDPAVHFCQLGIRDNPCQMFGRCAKRK